MTRKDDLTDAFRAAIDEVGLGGLKATSMFGSACLIVDDDGDVCIADGRADNLVFCPAVDEAGEVLNPDIVAEIVKRFNDAALTALRAERDELRAAIFGSGDYCKTLRNGNFVEMAQATEAGRKGAIARAEAAEARVAELETDMGKVILNLPPVKGIRAAGPVAGVKLLRAAHEAAEARVAELEAALNGPSTDLSEADHAAIVAHLSPECEPQSPPPNRNSLMMEVVRLRNALAAAEAGTLAPQAPGRIIESGLDLCIQPQGERISQAVAAAEAAALERAAKVVHDNLPLTGHKVADAIRALITPGARTALDAALADARKAGRLEGLREAVRICDRNDQVSGWVSRDAIIALAARVEGGDA